MAATPHTAIPKWAGSSWSEPDSLTECHESAAVKQHEHLVFFTLKDLEGLNSFFKELKGMNPLVRR